MRVHRLQDGYFDVEPTSFTIGMRVHRLKQEQVEAKRAAEGGESKSAVVPTSPALEAHDKKAVPGTPMDDKGVSQVD